MCVYQLKSFANKGKQLKIQNKYKKKTVQKIIKDYSTTETGKNMATERMEIEIDDKNYHQQLSQPTKLSKQIKTTKKRQQGISHTKHQVIKRSSHGSGNEMSEGM